MENLAEVLSAKSKFISPSLCKKKTGMLAGLNSKYELYILFSGLFLDALQEPNKWVSETHVTEGSDRVVVMD